MTRQLSSSWTLIFRIFFPTLWIAFFGVFTISVVFSSKTQIGGITTSGLGMGLLVFFFVFLFIFWRTVFRLKRIDATPEHVYVTNFFKNVRYKHAYVERVEVTKGILFHFGTLVLKEKATFGDRIPFIASKKRLEIFFEENPECRHWLVEAK